jgi:hypothetical protein
MRVKDIERITPFPPPLYPVKSLLCRVRPEAEFNRVNPLPPGEGKLNVVVKLIRFYDELSGLRLLYFTPSLPTNKHILMKEKRWRGD